MYQRILVPLDGSETSLEGLDEAVRLALMSGSKLRLVHVINHFKSTPRLGSHASYAGLVPGMKEAGEELLRQGRERAELGGVKAESILLTSLIKSLAELIAQEAMAWNADLIVIGTHGRRGIERLLWGSDAEQVRRMAPVSVLLVKASRSSTDGE
ncbi:universal stress protein [Variovorax sp. J22R133]|uniref:universal stress protein n=1 Tax=Variovorax brevis TaxID=3053503 RepID=UPI002578836D|nr:universal stress protein [Variovorax sp. J22R133]MDM0117171.1 universal stress protein [Variovorax sp. J22R133]